MALGAGDADVINIEGKSMNSCKYIKVRKVDPPPWEMLLIAADADYISYLLIAHYNLDMGSPLWLSQQSAEKYMKCYLLKDDPSYNPRKDGHNLKKIWSKVKASPSTTTIFDNKDYDHFIKELNSVNEDSRYGFSIDMERILFTAKIIQFGDDMRKHILGTDYKERGFSGLADSMLQNDVKGIICPMILTKARYLLAK